jgi:hypothetical protein
MISQSDPIPSSALTERCFGRSLSAPGAVPIIHLPWHRMLWHRSRRSLPEKRNRPTVSLRGPVSFEFLDDQPAAHQDFGTLLCATDIWYY